MKPQFEKAILIFRLIMIILIFTGLIIEGDFDIQYWTNQSNIMILIWLIFAVLFQSKSKLTSTVKSGLRGAVTVYILVTFLISCHIIGQLAPVLGLDYFALSNSFDVSLRLGFN